MKDRLGHGSDPRGAHAAGTDQVGREQSMFKTWGRPPVLDPITTPIQRQAMESLRASPEFGDAISRLPQMTGTVYRGFSAKAGDYTPGKSMTFDRHTSVAANDRDAAEFSTLKGVTGSGRGMPAVMQIDKARAADFSSTGHSTMPGYVREGIIPMGSRVRVNSVEPREFTDKRGRKVKGVHIRAEQL